MIVSYPLGYHKYCDNLFYDTAEVIRASRSVVADDQTQDEADDKSSYAGPEDTEMEDLDELMPEPEPKPRKRKEKKSIPIGRNGYKKKRVVKSKTSFDDDGYMGKIFFFLLIFTIT